MPLSVAVEHIDPRRPADATASAVGKVFALLAPARELMVGIAGWGDGPAVAVAPWTLDGLRRAAEQFDMRMHAIDLAPEPMHAGQRRRMVAAGVAPESAEGRPILLEVAGARRPRRVPRPWLGRHLCLVVPCAHVHRSPIGWTRRDRKAQWAGPVTAAFAALDHACRPAGAHADDPETGARLAAQVFASTTVVVDGSWWTPLHGAATAASAPVSLDRCFAASSLTPSESWNADALRSLDAWLAEQLHLRGAATAGAGHVDPRGSGARGPWPRATADVPSTARGLAGQAVKALWSAHQRRRAVNGGSPALPASVPGPLARWWHDYAVASPPASSR